MRRLSFIRESASIAFETLWAHRLRSFLTLLGVIIAVTALIGVVSAVNGLNSYVAERLANFGTNVFQVARFPIITNFKDYILAQRRNKMLTMDDYEFLKERVTLAEGVGAEDWRNKGVRGGNQNFDDVPIRGATANIIDLTTAKVEHGRFFTDEEVHRRAAVAYIGVDIADRLFPTVDPIGKTLMIDGLPFEIVGVNERVGSVLGQSQDTFINIPITTLRKNWGMPSPYDQGLFIVVKCPAPSVMEQAKDEARVLMRARHHLSYEADDNFGIVSSESVTSLWNSIFGGLANASIGMVSVFLVIGGIVIMNIMLATVTERTHEIGLRKSLGARKKDILMQFMVEASVMSAMGGLSGVVLATLVVYAVRGLTPMPMRMPLSAVVISVGVSTAVGLFFGLWPAMKAARLDPVEALRSE